MSTTGLFCPFLSLKQKQLLKQAHKHAVCCLFLHVVSRDATSMPLSDRIGVRAPSDLGRGEGTKCPKARVLFKRTQISVEIVIQNSYFKDSHTL